ncbi:enoyl-CoA hydratase-related protein [Streptomyces hyaluromycini]|uniref:Enoyl-CoA hydratase-related protein n=1 Tax=Streptomyces hyaluromycini TaxID=1377993 RepID=A0ABV1WP62_9ACTN
MLTGAGSRAFSVGQDLRELTGRRMTAETVLRWGLVNEVVPADDLDACVAEWVDALLRGAPLAARAIKESVMRSLDMALDEAFVTPFEWERRRMHSEDAVEGPRAFAEKREPRWRGI